MTLIPKIFAVVRHEFLQVLPPTIYFLFTFNIVIFTTAMALEHFEIHVSGHVVATVLALLVGKVVLVVNKLPLLRRFDGKPLIYPILFKSVIYAAFILFVRLLEHWVPAVIEAGTIAAATDHMMETVLWRLFWFAQIWIFILFVVYTAAVEVIRLFGFTSAQLLRAFYHEHPARMVADA
jgi:hypothetical protein